MMISHLKIFNANSLRGVAGLLLMMLSIQAYSMGISGNVVDLNGAQVSGAMVTLTPNYAGPTAVTVFSDAGGKFMFPEQDKLRNDSDFTIAVRALGYVLLTTKARSVSRKQMQLTVVVKPVVNQMNSVPASAWLQQVEDRDGVTSFVLDCIGCHQVPSGEFINYTHLIGNISGDNRAEINRQSWDAMVKYMNFVSAEEFSRGPNAVTPDAHNAYQVGNGDEVVKFLSRHFSEPMTSIADYDWGAPLITSATIYEYEITEKNAIREALLLGDPKQLYVADVATDLIYQVDPATGKYSSFAVPSPTPVGPHSLHRGGDGSLWVAPFVRSVVGHYDLEKKTWSTWPMVTVDGNPTAIHDLSFGADHTLLKGKDGKVWFSDIGNNAVGSLDTDSGNIEVYRVPETPGRPANQASLYGLVMESDREHIWYSQVGVGSLGRFNVITHEFKTAVHLPMNSGPRRLTISDDDVLYAPLYGAGQLLEYDARADKQIGIYDLPDTASAPYAVTWDPIRKVVWIPTSNADVIYRFDPSDKSFAVLPMPRQAAFLRMVDVDPDTGDLITSYANIVEQVHGPRMALIIDVGDNAYGK